MGNKQASRLLVKFFFFFLSPVTKLSSLALVTPTQLPQDGREQNEEVIQKEHEMLPRVQRPEECSGPL